MQETILQTEVLYTGRVIRLEVSQVQLHNGHTSSRELVRHPGAVAVVALDDAQNVLLVRQFRLPAGQVLVEIPAGTLEPNEDPFVCAERELQEETGHKPGQLERIGGMFVAPGYTDEFIHLFLATGLTESRLPGDEDEFIEYDRVPLTEAVAMITRGEIHDGKSIAALLQVARRLNV